MTRTVRRELPESATGVLSDRFPELGSIDFPAWIVGGAVRDLLLGVAFDDIDLTCVDARRNAERFARTTGSKCVDLGRDRFPTFRVVRRGRAYDLSEMEGGAIDLDLARRDFTINAMAVALGETAVIDPFGGGDDLDARRLRMVRPENFTDDPLRILRGIRFAATLDMDVDAATLDEMSLRASELARMAPERVRAELDLLLSAGAAARGLAVARRTGVDSILFGSMVDDDTIRAIDETSDRIVRWAILVRFHDVSSIEALANRWRWSRDDREEISRLVDALNKAEDEATTTAIAMKLYMLGRTGSERFTSIVRATSSELRAGKIDGVLTARDDLFDIVPLLDGNEIREVAGLPEGPAIGVLKRDLLQAQIDGHVLTRNDAIRWLRTRTATGN